MYVKFLFTSIEVLLYKMQKCEDIVKWCSFLPYHCQCLAIKLLNDIDKWIKKKVKRTVESRFWADSWYSWACGIPYSWKSARQQDLLVTKEYANVIGCHFQMKLIKDCDCYPVHLLSLSPSLVCLLWWSLVP